jgi:hypothetical protein
LALPLRLLRVGSAKVLRFLTYASNKANILRNFPEIKLKKMGEENSSPTYASLRAMY